MRLGALHTRRLSQKTQPSARRPRLVLRFRVCASLVIVFAQYLNVVPCGETFWTAQKSACFCRSFPMQCHRMFCDWGDFEASEELRHRRRACKAVLLALQPSPPEPPLWELCSRFPPLRCTSAASPCDSQYRAVKASSLRAKSATGRKSPCAFPPNTGASRSVQSFTECFATERRNTPDSLTS